jgi:uncharacterized protein
MFLDHYGDRNQQDSPSDYLLKIRQDSAQHRQQVLQAYKPLHRPLYQPGDWMTGAQTTAELMQQGVDYIYQGILVAESDRGIRYKSQPDLLVRQPGASCFGDWHYLPIDIKLGKKPKLEYQLVATFHAYLLSAVQGVWPESGYLILREKEYWVNLEQQLPRLLETIAACAETLMQPEAPEVFISRSRCDMCVWLPHCYQVAQRQQHLSLLPGVTPNRYRHLAAIGLTTVETLAQIEPARLTLSSGFELSVAERLVHQAQATLRGVAIARRQPDAGPFLLTPQDLPSAEVELYFDIEAAPDKDLVYLHGVLVVDHTAQKETFRPLIAAHPTEEISAWQQFQQVVAQYPTAPIYHFCPYEAQTVQRLAAIYGTHLDLDALLSRFVDIHKCITEAVTLPVESYALKHIARWIGFEWRDEAANGAQSICWYDSWLSSGDEEYLQAILRYNEDDCRATYHVKRWLTEFSQAFWA